MKIKYSIKKRGKITQHNCVPSDFVVGKKIIVRKGFNIVMKEWEGLTLYITDIDTFGHSCQPWFVVNNKLNTVGICCYPNSRGWHPEELDFEFVD